MEGSGELENTLKQGEYGKEGFEVMWRGKGFKLQLRGLIMRILLQFPEGLKSKALAEATRLEKEGNEVFLSAAPCFGACDVALDEAKAIKADRIIHYGHNEFMRIRSRDVEYVPFEMNVDWHPVMEKAIPLLEGKNTIALVTTVQHLKQLPEIKRFLVENGKRIVVGRGKVAKEEGQVLGCDGYAATRFAKEADCALYFGGGLFHPTSVTKMRVLGCNPFSNEVKWLDEELKMLEKMRKAALSGAAEAKRFGILLSTKPGQMNLRKARKIKEKLREAGREAQILVANHIDLPTLRNFVDFDCYVNTACPRMSDDIGMAGKPILNHADALMLIKMLNERRNQEQEAKS